MWQPYSLTYRVHYETPTVSTNRGFDAGPGICAADAAITDTYADTNAYTDADTDTLAVKPE
jgi:hypothetical protein